jgi:hypothetical protein
LTSLKGAGQPQAGPERSEGCAKRTKPRVGGGNTRTVNEGRRFAASEYPDGGAGADRRRGRLGRRD